MKNNGWKVLTLLILAISNVGIFALFEILFRAKSLVFVSNGERYEHVEHQDLSHQNYMMISGCGFTHSRGDCT